MCYGVLFKIFFFSLTLVDFLVQPPTTRQIESTLDIQFIIAAGTGVPSDFWLESSQNFDLMGWASYVLNQSTVQNQVCSVL